MVDELSLVRQLFDADPPTASADIRSAIRERVLGEAAATSPADATVHRSDPNQSHRPSGRHARPRQATPGRRRVSWLTVAVVGCAVLVVGGGNVAFASAGPNLVPAHSLPAPIFSPVPGTFIAVAAVSTAVPATLYLSGDPTGRSLGCVSLTPDGVRPPSTLPNSPTDAAPLNTFCASRTPGAITDGSGIGYEDAIDPQNPGLSRQNPVAFGFAPAGTVKVRIRLTKRGPAIFRLLNRTTTIDASLFGGALQLPIVAWEGPDLSGYSVRSIEAINKSSSVTASLQF